MRECDLFVGLSPNMAIFSDYPVTVLIRDVDGAGHVFRVTYDALTDDLRLKARRGGFAGETATVIVFSGEPPHEDGRCLEGRDFWDFTVPADLIRNVGTHSDPPRPKGRAKYLGTKEKL